MANNTVDRAASVNDAAKSEVDGQKCTTCPRKKCDAELPKDETTKKVALTIFAESTPHNTEEMTAIGSTMHNRVGHSGYRRAKDVDAVLNQTYKGRNGKTYYQYNGYQSDKYKRGEQGDLEPGDCEALKRAIKAAEDLKNNGVPAKYNTLTSFRTPNLVSAADKATGTQIGGHYFFSN
jgi:hypothetical protein